MTWKLSGCTEQHRNRINNTVTAIQERLPSHQQLTVHIDIDSQGRGDTQWSVRWQLGEDEHSFAFEGEDCESLADATVEMLLSAFPEPIWDDVPEVDQSEAFHEDRLDVDVDDDPSEATPSPSDDLDSPPKPTPLSKAEARAQRKSERRKRFRTPQIPNVVAPRTGTISLRGGMMSDFWRPWMQLTAGFDFHFPRNFAVEGIGMLNYTRKDLSSDPVQDLRMGGILRACNLRRAGRSFEIAFCIGVDVLSRGTSRYLAQTDTRVERERALELAFSTRTALTWWMHRAIGLSANLELAGRFLEWRVETGTRLRTPRPFRAAFALGLEFALPRSRA